MAVPARGFIRFAGLSGATAIAMGAYGAHGKFKILTLCRTYDTGYKLHLVHSVALLSMPLMRKPYLVGALMSTGMVIFSGSCYYHALTGNPRVRWITPYGGMMLICAWLAMLF
ncbi:hypothetical protein LOTGIDRAFT_109541 [Lottia gigantea]|uniref:Transmembrane protein 256 n=1 Tax=Lottia gigantea TaxID=225164 RepID=V4B3P2_LOTGI|nr:hypothetical protein LOTGIDRAFT_109541 [Lottia gigantea]ESP05003.1 hypothetical protein LOTGIDRAFT_109541 [Lottia gigantea]